MMDLGCNYKFHKTAYTCCSYRESIERWICSADTINHKRNVFLLDCLMKQNIFFLITVIPKGKKKKKRKRGKGKGNQTKCTNILESSPFVLISKKLFLKVISKSGYLTLRNVTFSLPRYIPWKAV